MQLARLRALIDGFQQAALYSEVQATNAQRQRVDLARLPVLTRSGLNELFPRLQQAYSGRSDVSTYTTGGSTGEPVQFMFSRKQQRLAGTVRLYLDEVLGWRMGMPRFALWADVRHVGRNIKSDKSLAGLIKHFMGGSDFFGGYIRSEREYLRFIKAVHTHPGCAVWGFSSMLTTCAKLMLERNLELPPGFLGAIWNCGETMYDQQQEVIQQAFGIKPRECYASRECSGTAMECDHGSLHVSPRYLIEVVDCESLELLPDGQTGSLLLTDLFNDATPLIRYEIGDLGAIKWRDCACGIRGWCITNLAGRVAWMIKLPSGTRISSYAFNAMVNFLPALHQWKVVRVGPAEFEVQHTGDELNDTDRQELLRMMNVALEGANVRITRVEEIDRTPTGKLLLYEDLTSTDSGADGHATQKN